MDFNDVETLLAALRACDFRTIKKCIRAGQSLNQIHPAELGVEDAPIFLVSCSDLEEPSMFQSLVVLRDKIDLHATDKDGANALFWCSTAYRLRFLLEQKVDIHQKILHTTRWVNPLTFRLEELPVKTKEDFALIGILLSAGCDPGSVPVPDILKPTIKNWLDSLDCAKQFFKILFDNKSLEREALEFL